MIPLPLESRIGGRCLDFPKLLTHAREPGYLAAWEELAERCAENDRPRGANSADPRQCVNTPAAKSDG